MAVVLSSRRSLLRPGRLLKALVSVDRSPGAAAAALTALYLAREPLAGLDLSRVRVPVAAPTTHVRSHGAGGSPFSAAP